VQNPPLLSDYLTGVRRLVHDSTGNYWLDAELIEYINQARFRVVSDTGCNRILQSVSTVASQETYPYSGITQGISTIDVLNITLLWGSMRVPLTYMPYTEFNLKMRAWQSFTARPVAFCVYGQNTIYLGPIPDQVYTMEWDTIVMPALLANYTDVDTIVFPYVEPVVFYAAYMAKFKEQSYEEAERFLKTYTMKVGMAVRSSFTRRITNPYSI